MLTRFINEILIGRSLSPLLLAIIFNSLFQLLIKKVHFKQIRLGNDIIWQVHYGVYWLCSQKHKCKQWRVSILKTDVEWNTKTAMNRKCEKERGIYWDKHSNEARSWYLEKMNVVRCLDLYEIQNRVDQQSQPATSDKHSQRVFISSVWCQYL